MGVEPVGVEHRCDRGPTRQRPRERDRPLAPAEPGAERERATASGRLQHGVDSLDREPLAVVGQPAGHQLGQLAGDQRLLRGRHARGHITGAGAHARARRHTRRPGEPARSPGDEHVPARELGPRRRPARQLLEHGRPDQADRARRRSAARDADVADQHLARVRLAGADPQAGLGGVEGDGHRGAHRLSADHPAGRVDSARDVDAEDRRGCGVDHGDRFGHGPARRALEAGPEQGVDDDAGSVQCLAHAAQWQRLGAGQALEVRARVTADVPRLGGEHHPRLTAFLAQQARHDEAIAAVVALAAHDRDRTVGGDSLHRARHARAGALHELQPRHALLLDRPAVDRAHRGRVEQRDQPVGQRRHGLRC